MSEIILSAQGVHQRFHEGPLDVTVLSGVDLSVSRGQSLAIVGASGSGKSTLLHLLGGLDGASQGRITLMGRDWAGMSAAEQGRWRNQHLGFIYQFHHLLPEFSALDNVAMPLLIRRDSLESARATALAMLDQVGLSKRAEHRPSELSGGERQRVAVARALVTGNLDRNTAETVFGLMREAAASRGSAMVMVTHDETLAARCDVLVRLVEGRVEGRLAA